MKTLLKGLKITGILLLLLILSILIWWFLPERTPAFDDEFVSARAGIEYLSIGGTEQCVLIRTEDTSNPVLLFLHGGPGMPMMYLAQEFQRPLEKEFAVVQWDRRGAGKSFHRNPPDPASINVRQLLGDAYQLIDTLRARYKQDQIILAGHSFGTYLGSIMVSERPELFKAYVSIGQVVDPAMAYKLQEEYIRLQADRNNRQDIIDYLDTASTPSFEPFLFEFGAELKNSKSFFPLIWSGLQAPEYTLPEVLDVAKASAFSSDNMEYNVLDSSIYYEIRSYDIPVLFIAGRHDYTTPWALIKQYYHEISAPGKELIIFENSAHFPFFEEPQKFAEVLSEKLK